MSASPRVVEAEFGSSERAAKTVPALGFSVQVDLGAGRAAVFQSAVAGDCDMSELNKMLDKINRAGDRQRAHYKIEEEEREIGILTKMQEDHDADMRNAAKQFDDDQTKLGDELVAARNAVTAFAKAKADDHLARGRRGQWEPTGGEKSKVNAIQSGVTKLEEEINVKRNERRISLAQYEELKRSRKLQLDKHHREIARCRAIIDAGT